MIACLADGPEVALVLPATSRPRPKDGENRITTVEKSANRPSVSPKKFSMATPRRDLALTPRGRVGALVRSPAARSAVKIIAAEGLKRVARNLFSSSLDSSRDKRRNMKSKKAKAKRNMTKTLAPKGSKLKCVMDNLAVHIHKVANFTRLVANANQKNWLAYGVNNSLLEVAASNLRFFDANTNSLVTKAGAGYTFRTALCVKVFAKVQIRNNYQTPLYYRVYYCRPKTDTFQSPSDLYTNGLTDQGNPDPNSPLMFLTDSKAVTDVWNVSLAGSGYLNAGQQRSYSRLVNEFEYHSQLTDVQGDVYKKSEAGHVFHVEIFGAIGHDSGVVTEQGRVQCGVDVHQKVVYTFQYDAGIPLYDFSLSDNGDVFTNGSLVSNKPQNQQEGYTI